jgi:hypothetical protein
VECPREDLALAHPDRYLTPMHGRGGICCVKSEDFEGRLCSAHPDQISIPAHMAGGGDLSCDIRGCPRVDLASAHSDRYLNISNVNASLRLWLRINPLDRPTFIGSLNRPTYIGLKRLYICPS